jgi:activator of HSP90 ATPase
VNEISRTAESIHQEVTFGASCMRVYRALTDPSQFDQVIKLSAAAQSMPGALAASTISREPGGAFSIFGGQIIGRHLELVPNARLVQAWRDKDWPSGTYSIVTFVLRDEGAGCRLIFDHTGFPAGEAAHLAEGWHGNYWDPMLKFLR